MSATGESGLGHKVEETKQYAQEKAGQTQEAAKVALIMQISYAIWLAWIRELRVHGAGAALLNFNVLKLKLRRRYSDSTQS